MPPAAAAVLLLLLAPAAAQKQRPRAEARDLHFEKWLQEDVGYIITPEERAAFVRLKTVEEREQFVEQFWARRDPDSRTPVNELKEEHYRRIAHANDHFKSAIDGWATDRGRIYIVLGPPTSVERHPTGGTYIRPLSEGGGITDTFPFEVWHYAEAPALGRALDIEFVDPTQTGEYRMAVRDTDKDALFMTPGLGPTILEDLGLETREGRIRSSDAMRSLGLQGDTQSGVLTNPLLKIQEYFRLRRPPNIRFQDLRASVQARIRYDDLPFRVRCDVLRVSREWLLCPVTLELAHRDLLDAAGGTAPGRADVNVYGRVERLNRQVAYEFEDVVSAELSPRAPGARSLYQHHLPLGPGRYKLTLALRCLQTGRMGTTETLVVVPTPVGGLETSSLLPARRIGAARAGESFPAPFTTTGGLKVYPNVTGDYEVGEPVALYAEIYDPAIDPASRQPGTKVVAEIAPEGAGAPVVSEDVTAAATVFDGAKITVAKMWPDPKLSPGRYVLRLRADDTIRNQSRVSSARFRVTLPAPPPTHSEPR